MFNSSAKAGSQKNISMIGKRCCEGSEPPIRLSDAKDGRKCGYSRNERYEMSDHSGLMPANWITFAHFSDSAVTKAPNSVEVNVIGMVPSSASRDLMVGFASPALISWLRRAMISGGVPFGTPTPATSWPRIQEPSRQ